MIIKGVSNIIGTGLVSSLSRESTVGTHAWGCHPK